MTEVTEEARAELAAIIAAMGGLYHELHLPVMLALDKHHGRTPPDPMRDVAVRLLEAGHIRPDEMCINEFNAFLAQLHKEFPNG